jgi:hypothetical protein
MADLLAGFDWTTPFIADACVQLSPASSRRLPRAEVQLPRQSGRGTGPAGAPRRQHRRLPRSDRRANQGDVLVIDNGGRTTKAASAISSLAKRS